MQLLKFVKQGIWLVCQWCFVELCIHSQLSAFYGPLLARLNLLFLPPPTIVDLPYISILVQYGLQ